MATDDRSQGEEDLARRVEQLHAQVAVNTANIDALQTGSQESLHRADSSEGLAKEDRQRIDVLESRVDVDHELIVQLQAEGLVNAEVADHLLVALRTSR